jgi:hypothetical protein
MTDVPFCTVVSGNNARPLLQAQRNSSTFIGELKRRRGRLRCVRRAIHRNL